MEQEAIKTRQDEILKLELELMEKWQQVRAMKRELPPEPVDDATLRDHDGNPVRLSELFGASQDLILIHNMGRSCRWCTLWADGFTGFLPHLESRAAFVLVSPDEPEVQRDFARSRGWKIRMLSAAGTSFIRDLGFEPEPGHYQPGFSTLHKEPDGRIVRISWDYFGPGDPYCSVWHIFDLLKDGTGDWEPQYKYPVN
ncbi:MAG: DUF899 domain-containing protein [Calditrichaeota bacterium]|nr:DUF899 domain-containing protein [Calditrichota bacterium]